MQEKFMASLAWDRGYQNNTFATKEELAFAGYTIAWNAGRMAALIDEALSSLRFDGVPGIEVNGAAQHRVNQAIYSLLALRRTVLALEGK